MTIFGVLRGLLLTPTFSLAENPSSVVLRAMLRRGVAVPFEITGSVDFFFSLDLCYDQLVASGTRNMPDRGLMSIVPDYHRVTARIVSLTRRSLHRQRTYRLDATRGGMLATPIDERFTPAG